MTSITARRTTTERRRFIRIPADYKVVAARILFCAKGDKEAWGELKNISCGGILFTTDLRCCARDKLKVVIHLPAWEQSPTEAGGQQQQPQFATVTAICRVLRAHETSSGRFELAARFEDVYKEDMAALVQFIERETQRLAYT